MTIRQDYSLDVLIHLTRLFTRHLRISCTCVLETFFVEGFTVDNETARISTVLPVETVLKTLSTIHELSI